MITWLALAGTCASVFGPRPGSCRGSRLLACGAVLPVPGLVSATGTAGRSAGGLAAVAQPAMATRVAAARVTAISLLVVGMRHRFRAWAGRESARGGDLDLLVGPADVRGGLVGDDRPGRQPGARRVQRRHQEH